MAKANHQADADTADAEEDAVEAVPAEVLKEQYQKPLQERSMER